MGPTVGRKPTEAIYPMYDVPEEIEPQKSSVPGNYPTPELDAFSAPVEPAMLLLAKGQRFDESNALLRKLKII